MGTWRSLHTEQREGRMCFEGQNREAGSGASTGCAAREGVHPVRCRAGQKIGWAAAMKSRGCAAAAGGPGAYQRPSGREERSDGDARPQRPRRIHTLRSCAALRCAAQHAQHSLRSVLVAHLSLLKADSGELRQGGRGREVLRWGEGTVSHRRQHENGSAPARSSLAASSSPV